MCRFNILTNNDQDVYHTYNGKENVYKLVYLLYGSTEWWYRIFGLVVKIGELMLVLIWFRSYIFDLIFYESLNK